MSNKIIVINEDVNELLDKCIIEYLIHHPEMCKIKISRNKIIFEIAKWYLR